MLLTPEQLYEIQKIIAEHHYAFTANTMGHEAVPPEVLKKLKEKGLLTKPLDSIGQSYTYGQLLGTKETQAVANMSYADFQQYMKNKQMPLTAVERGAMQMAAHNAGQYCRGLGNRVDIATGAILVEADRKLRARMEADIRTATEENIAKRETVEQLKSDLGWATNDWARDMNRIAATEKVTAMNQGTSDYFKKDHGADVTVVKRALPSACKHCQRLYNGPNGPRAFKLSDLEANGTNVGRKANDWLPTVGATHPNCFTGDTLVTTSRGEVPIEKVSVGDFVLCHDSKMHRVSCVFKSKIDEEIVRLTGEDWEVECTPNHPFYVNGEWRRSDSLQQGEHLVHKIDGEDLATTHDYPKHDPSVLNEVHSFLRILNGMLCTGVPITAIDFNGDLFIREGDVDIVNIDGVLRDSGQTEAFQLRKNEFLTDRIEVTLAGLSYFGAMFSRVGRTPDGLVCGSDSSLALFGSKFTVPDQLRGVLTTRPISSLSDSQVNDVATDLELLTYSLDREQIIEVKLDTEFRGDIQSSGGCGTPGCMCHSPSSLISCQPIHSEFGPLCSSPAKTDISESSSDCCCADSENGGHFTGQLFLVKESGEFVAGNIDTLCHCVPIIGCHKEDYKGFVYNLHIEGAESYFANGILVHNCSCVMLRLPQGWGFDEHGDMVPGGEVDMYESPEELEQSIRAEDDLQKAFALQGRVNFQGLDIAIENKEGSVRKWKDLNGNSGETEMVGVSYGYVEGTLGADEDEIDVFVGPDPRATEVYVIEQQNPHTGQYDECKAFIGFGNQKSAEFAYKLHYDNPMNFIITVQPMSLDHFKRLIARTQPLEGEMMKATEPTANDELKLVILIPDFKE